MSIEAVLLIYSNLRIWFCAEPMGYVTRPASTTTGGQARSFLRFSRTRTPPGFRGQGLELDGLPGLAGHEDRRGRWSL